MTLYELSVEELNNKTSDVYFEDFIDLFESSMLSYMNDDEIDTIEEGANIDMTIDFVAMKKKLREKTKEANKAIRKKDYDTAEKAMDEMVKIIDTAEKEIRSVNSGKLSSIILGKCTAFLIDLIEVNFPLIYLVDSLLVSGANDIEAVSGGLVGAGKVAVRIADLAGKTMKIGGGLSLVFDIVTIFRKIKIFFDELKNKDNNPGEAWNGYRNRLLKFMAQYKNSIIETKKSIAKLKKNYSSEK